MTTYMINKLFGNETQLDAWLDANLRKHPDGIRRLYEGKIVWAINLEQTICEDMRRGPIKLTSIDTWND